MNFVKTDISEFVVNPVKMISEGWYLITSGDSKDFNTMTASWGAVGEMWGKHTFTCAVRPNRHTYGYIESNDLFSVSFFDEKYKPALSFCGSHSGRDCDKIKETGLTPVTVDGVMTFEEADMVIICRKMYAQDLDEKCFTDKSALKFYENDPLHKMYISEIMGIYRKK